MAKSAVTRLAKGDRDATDDHLFRASLGQLKSHPRMQDFLASVTLHIEGNFIIGEPFKVHYNYKHKREKLRLHAPGDWIGIFEEGVKGEDSKEEDVLICWCEVPEAHNVGFLNVDRLSISKASSFHASYFVNGSERLLGKSETFRPRFVGAAIDVIGPTEEKEWASIKRREWRHGDVEEAEVEIKCGVR